MSVLDKINEDLKIAMRAKDALTRDTLRMLKADFAKEDNPDEIAVLTRAVKSRRDSVESFREAGRDDLVAKEEAEIQVVQRYLPKQLTEDEAKDVVAKLVEELGITEKKQLGQLMKAVMERYKGQLDGKVASRIAGQLLG